MAHEEFPPLTQEAADVLRDAEHDLNLTDPDWRRRYLAAGFREGMRQVERVSGTARQWRPWIRLEAIADNLHTPPPLLPTPEDLDQALATVLRHVECHEGSFLAKQVAILRAGVAHYPKG
jgi:hypothetical protein